MSFTGYRIYRGVGDVSNIDLQTPVATAPAGASSAELAGLGHSPSICYVYLVRAVLDDLELPDVSCVVEFETDAEGNYLGPRPAAVMGLSAEPISDARVRLSWSYQTPPQGPPVAEFAVYAGASPQAMPEQPEATLPFTRDGDYSLVLTMQDAATCYFAATARTAGGVESRPGRIVGPVVAVGQAPPQPVVLTDLTF